MPTLPPAPINGPARPAGGSRSGRVATASGNGVGRARVRRKPSPPAPRLRLVGADEQVRPQVTPPPQTRLAGSMDPRWVLAVRVAEHLQGSILPPSARDRLVRLGKTLGLTPFDANLIIAIVQDQARRGYAPAYCPTASEPQLRMVPPPRPPRWPSARRALLTLGLVAGLLVLELLLLSRVF